MKHTIYRTIILFSIVSIAGLSSCKKDQGPSQADIDDSKISDYLQSNGITATKDSRGFYYEKITENPNGTNVDTGMIVSFRYKISIMNGPVLEDLIAKDSSVLYRQGTGNMYPVGLDYGIGLMKTHEKYKFYIPSTLAYGTYSNTSFFQANTIFVVEAVVDSVFSETDRFLFETDSIKNYLAQNQITDYEKFAPGLFIHQTLLGTGDIPFSGNSVTINFTRKTFSGTILYTTIGSNPVTFTLGTGAVIEGLDDGIRQMREGGKATLYIPSALILGASVRVVPSGLMDDLYNEGHIGVNIPPYTPFIYEVELVSIN